MNIDLDDLEQCDHCGIVFNKYTVKNKRDYDNKLYCFTCPLCKKESCRL